MRKNIHITQRADGNWQGIRENASRASFITITQKEACAKARNVAIKDHVEMLIHGKDGKIRARNSYGNDPYPPKG